MISNRQVCIMNYLFKSTNHSRSLDEIRAKFKIEDKQTLFEILQGDNIKPYITSLSYNDPTCPRGYRLSERGAGFLDERNRNSKRIIFGNVLSLISIFISLSALIYTILH